MLAWELARQWQQENGRVDFDTLLGHYFSHGLLHVTPSIFLAAKEARWDPLTRQVSFNDSPNAWFVELAAGRQTNPVREFLRLAPRPHSFLLWCRRGSYRVHAWPWEQLARRVNLNR